MIDQFQLRPTGAEAASGLRIFLLGPAWIEWEGRTLNVLRRQARALLYRLATDMQPVPREELCYACWPDVAESVAHRYLSHMLSHLRDALPEPDLIRCNSELVELDAVRVWSDAAAFARACSVLDTQHESQIREGLLLYRGSFLAGFSLPGRPEFELWVAQQRSTCERLYLDALAVMVTADANRADWTRAIAYAREYLKVDELAEEMHRRLMVLYIMIGDRASALQQYQHCELVLKRELDVPPLPETRAIYDAIRLGI